MWDNFLRRKAMAVKRFPTEYPGVRYKEHPTRKHGVRKDRYFSVRYGLNGKIIEEGLGWASEGMTAQRANGELAKLKEARRTGQGAHTLREKRLAEEERRKAEHAAKEKAKADNITFLDVFTNHYLPEAERSKKPLSVKREKEFSAVWICPLVGDLPLREITLHHMETLKNRMLDAGRAAATVKYCLAIVRQVYHYANDHGLCDGQDPTHKVKRPAADNKRTRFLSKQEAQLILDALQARSIETYNMALFSLHTGARLGEITSLCWGDVDMQTRMLTFRDTKNKDSRHAQMTQQVFETLFSLQRGRADELVFPGRGGKQMVRVSRTFDRVIDSLGLNEDAADRRQRICFHSLRHSFASWARKSGADLFALQRLLGHKTPAMVARYAHVDDETINKVMTGIEKGAGAVDTRIEVRPVTTNKARGMALARERKVRKAE
jgi:integrase